MQKQNSGAKSEYLFLREVLFYVMLFSVNKYVEQCPGWVANAIILL